MTSSLSNIQTVLTGLLHVLYQYSGGALILTFLIMVMYEFIKKYGTKGAIALWLKSFARSAYFRNMFFMLTAVSMLLYKTILCRFFAQSPLALVIGHWKWQNAKGTLFTDMTENAILYAFIAFFAFNILRITNRDKRSSRDVVIMLFLSPLAIEFIQLFLVTGRFQLSDIAYAWSGIVIGLSVGVVKNMLCVNNDDP